MTEVTEDVKLNKDGTIRRKPGPKPGTVPGKGSGAPRSAAKGKGGPDYRQGVLGLFQVAAVPLSVAGMKSDAAMADAVAIGMHAPTIADAVHQLATENVGVANALDKLLKAGPYAALISAVVPLAVQIATNHNAIPVGVAGSLGAQDPRALAAAGKQQLISQMPSDA